MSLYFGYESSLDLLEEQIQKNKNLIAVNKTDIKTERARVDTNKSNISTNTSSITSNVSDILLNGTRVVTAQSKADSAYNKAVSNGDKILKKISAMENFEFIYINPTAGSWSEPQPHTAGHPSGYVAFLNRNLETYIHLQFHLFDSDTTLDGTEKALYLVTFLDTSGNIHTWTSPQQTISSKKLLNTAFVVDVKLHVSAQFNNWDTFRAFKAAYQLVSPSKVGGNENRLYVTVYSI